MTNKPKTSDDEHMSESAEIAKKARNIMRRGMKATLATLHQASGHPYASLVLVATEFDNSPILLISNLAVHTQNILKDERSSLLFDDTAEQDNPLEGSRLSIWGNLTQSNDPEPRSRFLARHPEATFYADFDDFSFFRMEIQAAHFVAGFGMISGLSPRQLILDTTGAEDLEAAETNIVDHMNEDHHDAIQLYATRLLDGHEDNWVMAGCDPEGCDLKAGRHTLRLDFPDRVNTPEEIRMILVQLVGEARTVSKG